METAQRRIEISKRINWVIWGGFCYMLSLSIGIIYLVIPAGKAEFAVSETVLSCISGAGIFIAALSLFIRRLVFTSSRVRVALNWHHGQVLTDEEKVTALAIWTRLNVALWTLNELIAVLGITQAILTHDARRAFPYLAASLVLNLLMRPRFDLWTDALRLAD